MRLVGQIQITVRGDVVKRDPTLWERVKQGLGGQVDLETEQVKNGLEATAVVDGVRRALGRLGVDNALALVIDDTVIFQDADGKPGDLPDLVLALADHASVFGRGFRELRFAAEHDEAGVHLVIETRARTAHRRDEPAAVVSVGGRLRALEPQSGESAEAYRARVQPLTENAALFEAARLSFQSFVARLQQALAAAMPDAAVVEKKAEARLVKPSGRDVAAPARTPQEPMHPGYDPFLIYHPWASPMGMVLDAMIFSSLVHMMMPPPFVMISPGGAPLGVLGSAGADDLQPYQADGDDGDHDRAPPHDEEAGAADEASSSDDAGDADGDVAHEESVWDHGGGFDDGGGGFDDGGFGGDD